MGIGVVGSTVRRWFESRGHQVHVYDPPKGYHDEAALADADVVFVCVPTPYGDNGFDATHLEAAVATIPGGRIVVVKSTVLPGTTEALQDAFPQHRFMFSPEFLRERSAYEDFVAPDRQILGYTRRSQAYAEMVLGLLPNSPYARAVPATEAELVKYVTNAFLALKVTFANEVYDLCERIGARYDLVKEGAAADDRIGSSHMDPLESGYRGYAGRCLPKDMKAFIDFAAEQGIALRLLKTADILNDRRRAAPSAPDHVRAVAPLRRHAKAA